MRLFRSPPKEASVFVSYRRRDLDAVARLADSLNTAFGEDHVFFDLADIHAGARWEALLDTQLLASDVLVAAISEHWLSEFDSHSDDADFVLREISLALQEGIPIIPVFFPGVSAPALDQLPPRIWKLMSYQGINADHFSWADKMGDLVESIYLVVGAPNKEARQRKVNEAKVMAQWFSSADVDEEMLARAAGTREVDPALVVSDRRFFIGLPNGLQDPVELSPGELFAACYQDDRLWLLGLEADHAFEHMRPGGPEELTAQLRKQCPELQVKAGRPDTALWQTRRIARARDMLNMSDDLLATAGDEQGDPVLFVTPQASVVFRRKQGHEGLVTIGHDALGAICVHRRTVWLLGGGAEHKIDNLPLADFERLVLLIGERAPKARLFRKPPDRQVRESLIVWDPLGLASQNGIDLTWTSSLRPTAEEAIVLAVTKLHIMEADLVADPDWDDRIVANAPANPKTSTWITPKPARKAPTAPTDSAPKVTRLQNRARWEFHSDFPEYQCS